MANRPRALALAQSSQATDIPFTGHVGGQEILGAHAPTIGRQQSAVVVAGDRPIKVAECTGRLQVVAARVVGVDGTQSIVVGRAHELMAAEAGKGLHAAAVQLVGIAQKELEHAAVVSIDGDLHSNLTALHVSGFDQTGIIATAVQIGLLD